MYSTVMMILEQSIQYADHSITMQSKVARFVTHTKFDQPFLTSQLLRNSAWLHFDNCYTVSGSQIF